MNELSSPNVRILDLCNGPTDCTASTVINGHRECVTVEHIDWHTVRQLRSICFHRGVALHPNETLLLYRAMAADSRKYNEIGDDIRDEYKSSLGGKS